MVAVLPNCFEFFEVSMAAARLGAPFLPVNWHLKADELAYIVEDSGALVAVARPRMPKIIGAKMAVTSACTGAITSGPMLE